MLSDRGRDAWLDGVRGVAVLVVIFGHCSNFGVHVVPGLHLGGTAKAGVWVFFMLSAYLLGAKLIRQFERGHHLARVVAAYAVRRVLRIMPLYLVVLAALVALGIFDVGTATRNAVLVEGWGHFWTIPVEMKFYVVLPFLAAGLALMPARWRLGAAILLFCASVAAFVWLQPYSRIAANSLTLLTYVAFFVLGLVVLLGSRGMELTPKAGMSIAVAGIVATILMHPRSIASWSNVPMRITVEFYLVAAIAMAAVFFAAATSRPVRVIFEAGLLRFFGLISFGAYLAHYFIIPEVAEWQWLPHALKGVLAIALTVLVAGIFYYLIERLMLRWGARIAHSINGERPAVQSHAGVT